MSLTPCDRCRKRVPEKLCQTTWAWYRTDGERVAYRQRLCTACFAATLLPISEAPDFENLSCPACHVSTDRDMDPVYATVFFPGMGKQQYEFALCAPCAVEIRNRAQEGAVKLEGMESRGASASPSTLTTRESYWAGLGIIPREP
jgi:ribosomal protein S27AE